MVPADDLDETEFTIIGQEDVEVTEVTDVPTVPAPSSASTTPPSSLDLESTAGSTYTMTTRRHVYPNLIPLLTMVRYMSTIKFAEVVTTSFTSSGIHHSAVSTYYR